VTTSRWHYSKALAEQLRVNGVAEGRVREIVAQAEAHTLETGEDPVDAFGQPVEYAAQWQRLSPRRWMGQVLLGLALSVGVMGIFKAVVADQPWGTRVPLTTDDVATFVLFVVLLAVMPWSVDLWLSRRRGAELGESRPQPEWPIRLAVMCALASVVTMLAWVLGSLSARPTLAEVPRWLLLAVGLLGVGVAFTGGPHPGDDWYPRSPLVGDQKESWKTRVRRAFYNP
jgi:hypothetical protein